MRTKKHRPRCAVRSITCILALGLLAGQLPTLEAQSVEERIEATLDTVDRKRRQVSNAFDAGRAAAREARGELEQRIAESKAAYKDS